MSALQLLFFENLEQDTPFKPSSLFHARLIESLNRKDASDADVVRATGIPWSTWMSWIWGETAHPVAGEHFKNVCRYLEVSSDYLLGLDE